MKKKILACLLCAALVFTITACGGGNTEHVKVAPIHSDIYTKDDYDAAVKVAMTFFRNNFEGCTMTKIRYAGDSEKASMKAWAKEYGADEAILLLSDFKTDKNGGDGSFDPNETYTDWQWILVRDKGGKWHHKDHGYG